MCILGKRDLATTANHESRPHNLKQDVEMQNGVGISKLFIFHFWGVIFCIFIIVLICFGTSSVWI